MTVCAVVGGQFGSEGKGGIVAHVAKQYGAHVRVGAANAGHTFYVETPKPRKCVMQQLPCAAYANPDATLYIGPGALISPEIFLQELEANHKWRQESGHRKLRVWVDPRAHVISGRQVALESKSGLAERIGSTSATAREGIGQAQADRVMRSIECIRAFDYYYKSMGPVYGADVPLALRDEESVLLEGTQGYGLSLTTGQFPYVTSRNTTAAGLCADTGIAPNRLDRVILAVRTYPIRVANPPGGTSGPFAKDSAEITWQSIGVDPETERTTVTKKIRRVATFSLDQVAEAAMVNGATEIALTFTDYLDPNIRANSELRGGWFAPEYSPRVAELIKEIERETKVPVTMLGAGPRTVIHNQGGQYV